MNFFSVDLRRHNCLGLSTSVHKEWLSLDRELDRWSTAPQLGRFISKVKMEQIGPLSLRFLQACSELSLPLVPVLSWLISICWSYFPPRDSFPNDSSGFLSISQACQASPLLSINSICKEDRQCVYLLHPIYTTWVRMAIFDVIYEYFMCDICCERHLG